MINGFPNYILQGLSVDISTENVSITALYATDVIVRAEVDVILNHFETALRFMINHPNELICDVPLVNADEMRVIVPVVPPDPPTGLSYQLKDLLPPLTGDDVEGSSSRRLGSVPTAVESVSDLIRLQIERTPHRIAVSDSIHTWNRSGSPNLLF